MRHVPMILALAVAAACGGSHPPSDATVDDDAGAGELLEYPVVCAELEEALSARLDDCGDLSDLVCPWWDREGACWTREALEAVVEEVAAAECIAAPKTAWLLSCRE